MERRFGGNYCWMSTEYVLLFTTLLYQIRKINNIFQVIYWTNNVYITSLNYIDLIISTAFIVKREENKTVMKSTSPNFVMINLFLM